MNRVEVPTYTALIYVAGSLSSALRIAREFCDDRPECVTVEPVSYVFVGGSADGVRVGLINYGRFPRETDAIFAQAEALALRLIEELGQESASIVASDRTVWLSNREQAA